MSSTNRTTNLGLNQWLETDRPKRTDFVSDNVIIDNVLGGHVNDTARHLTADEKAYISQPFITMIAYGTGNENTVVHLDFAPSLVIASKIGAPPVKVSGSVVYVNSGVATRQGASAGLRIEGNDIYLCESTQAENGVFLNLNENYSQYVLTIFR